MLFNNGYATAFTRPKSQQSSLQIGQCESAWKSNVHSMLTVVLFPISRIVQAYSVWVTVAAGIDTAIATLLPAAVRLMNKLNSPKKKKNNAFSAQELV